MTIRNSGASWSVYLVEFVELSDDAARKVMSQLAFPKTRSKRSIRSFVMSPA